MQQHVRPSRLRRPAAIAGVLATCVVLAAFWAVRDNGVDAPGPSPADVAHDEADWATDALAETASDSGSSSERPVYRYSVVPGGTYNEGELQAALDGDPVVAAHYKQLDRSRVRKEVVARDRLVHVSYRKGNDVFWTKKKVLLRQGETILTDGKTQIRARCGNCVAEEALGPTSDDEPDAVEFDRLVTNRPVPPIIAPPPVAAATPPSTPQRFTPASGLVASGAAAGGGSSGPLASGNFGGGGGASVPLVRADPAGGAHQPGDTNDPGSNSPAANGPDGTPGNSQDPQTPGGNSPQPPGGNAPGPQPPAGNSPSPGPGGGQPAIDVPIPDGDDQIPSLEEITLVPTGPENPGPDDPGNPTTGEVPPGGQPVNPVTVPEPATLLLVGGGVAALIRRRARAQSHSSAAADKRDTL